VLFILVEIALVAWPSSIYLWHSYREIPLRPDRQLLMGLSLGGGIALSIVAWLWSMRSGIRALGELSR
jgi:hypothetical protein